MGTEGLSFACAGRAKTEAAASRSRKPGRPLSVHAGGKNPHRRGEEARFPPFAPTNRHSARADSLPGQNAAGQKRRAQAHQTGVKGASVMRAGFTPAPPQARRFAHSAVRLADAVGCIQAQASPQGMLHPSPAGTCRPRLKGRILPSLRLNASQTELPSSFRSPRCRGQSPALRGLLRERGGFFMRRRERTALRLHRDAQWEGGRRPPAAFVLRGRVELPSAKIPRKASTGLVRH